MAALFALTAAAVFTIAATVWAAARGAAGAVRAGLGGVGLVLVAGNLEGARLLIADGGPLRDYDWFAASRIDPDTITEFPWFSFLLGDLHAHVLALPFTLLALAFALQVVLTGPQVTVPLRVALEACGAALATGFLYTVNSWSYPVMAGVLVLAVVAWLRDPRSAPARPAAVRWLLAVLALSVLLVLPFHLSFDPAARGIGVVDEGRGFAGWLRDELLLFGSLLVFVALAYLGLLLSTRRPGRNAVWIAVAVVFAGSLLAALEWAHVALLAALLVVALMALLAQGTPAPLRLVWLLVAAGIACMLGPEILYVRDEFDGSALYRMNTVFKLDYQAWLLLGLAAIGALAWWRVWLPRRARAVGVRAARRHRRARRGRLPGRRHVRAQGRVRGVADARRPRVAARPRAGRSRRDRVAQRPRAGRCRRARSGGGRLLRVRARPHLHVHRHADRAGVARPRAPVGSRRRGPARRRSRARTAPRPPRRRCRSCAGTACATWSWVRSSGPTTAMRAWRSGTRWDGACTTPTARSCGS